MPIYATTAELAEWTGEAAPANADQLLRQASRLVRRATMTAIYVVDEDDLPTDADVLAAFRDATCAQVASWAALGIDPTAGPASVRGAVQSSSIGGGTVTYADTSTTKAAAVDNLASEAWLILADAGLLPTTVLR